MPAIPGSDLRMVERQKDLQKPKASRIYSSFQELHAKESTLTVAKAEEDAAKRNSAETTREAQLLQEERQREPFRTIPGKGCSV